MNQKILISIIQDDDDLSFENNINNHDESSTRIIFTNTNGLSVDIDAYSLREILINSILNSTNIILLAEINNH